MNRTSVAILIALIIVVANTILVQTSSSGGLQQRIVASFRQDEQTATNTTKKIRSVAWTASILNDQTLNWSTTVIREWEGIATSTRMKNNATRPPAMLLLTNFGWNQPNQTAGQEIYRGKRTRTLIHGVINHPWFHPTAWVDIMEGRMAIDDSIRYYVFLDREMCAEKNYPGYMEGLHNNRDDVGGRGEDGGWREHHIHEIMNSPIMFNHQTNTSRLNNTRYLLFDCGGHGPKPYYVLDRMQYNTSQLVLVSVSALQVQHQPQDLGLPPPAIRPYIMTGNDREAIRTCAAETNRTILVSYSGQLRSAVRKELAKLDNQTVLMEHAKNRSALPKIYMKRRPTQMDKNAGDFLHQLALDSIFSLAPRGDNLFSYRFTEVMSCGSIPVVLADRWVYPFSPLFVNWSDSIVILPESRANETIEILENMPLEERCQRRQRVVALYDKYLSSGEGTIVGLVESLELAAKSGPYNGTQRKHQEISR